MLEGTRRPPTGDSAAGGARPSTQPSATARTAPTVVVDVQHALPDVLARLDRAASSVPPDSEVHLAIPPGSSLFLTASEFRALREVAVRARVALIIETEDPLRRQLASMFGLGTVEVGAPPRPRLLLDNDVPAPRGPQPLAPAEPVSISSRTNGRSFVPQLSGTRSAASGATTANPSGQALDRRTSSDPPSSISYELDDPQASAPRSDEWEEIAANSGGIRPRTILIGVCAVVLAAVIVIGAFAVVALVFARANVLVELRQETVTTQTTLHVVADNVGSASPDGAVVPGRYVTIDVMVDQSVPTTGQGDVGQTTASGTVQLANPTDSSIDIAAGEVATGDTGVQVKFLDTVSVPASSDQGPGQAEIRVETVRLGSAGNLGVGELNGRLDNGAYFSNRLAALSGGTDTNGRIVAEADLENLQTAAQTAATEVAQREFSATLESGTTAIPATFDFGDPELTFDHSAGDAADAVTVHAVYKVTALTYRAEDAEAQLRDQVLPALAANAPDGLTIEDTSLRFAEPRPIDTDDVDGPGASFAVTASARAVATFTAEDQAALADRMAGASESEAEAILRDHPAIDDATIKHSPRWPVFGMPDDAGRIDITIED